MNPLVSVVIPVYNMGNALEQCVNSLLKQDYNNYEIILVDDGSTDISYDICERLEKENTIIRLFHTENRGSGPARNYGIEKAHGSFVYFPDADDYLEPNGLSIMVNATKDDCDLVVFGFQALKHRRKTVRIKKYEDCIKDASEIRNDYSDYVDMSKKWGIQGAPWNKLFKRSIIIDNNVKYPELRRHQDEGFISRYMCYSRKVHFIPDVLYTYFVNDIGKEWDKYPVDYISNVNALYGIRKETILRWNPSDIKTRYEVERSYINKFIKALELSYSPKMGLDDNNERRKWMEKQVEKYRFVEMNKEVGLRKYQRIICDCIGKGNMRKAMRLMHLKVSAEKSGILGMLNLYHR